MKRPTPSSVKASMLNCSAAAAAAACAACSCGVSAGADMVVNATQRWMPASVRHEGKQSTVLIYIQTTPGVHFVLVIPTLPITSRRSCCPLSEGKMSDNRPCYALGCLIAPLTQWNCNGSLARSFKGLCTTISPQ